MFLNLFLVQKVAYYTCSLYLAFFCSVVFTSYPGSQSLSGHGDLPHPFSQVCSAPCAHVYLCACHILISLCVDILVSSRLYWRVMLRWITSNMCISLLLEWDLQRKFLEMEFLGQKVKKICRHNFIRFCHISLHRVIAFCDHRIRAWGRLSSTGLLPIPCCAFTCDQLDRQ